MSVKIGDAGGIRIAPETTYGTAGTVFVAQHARTASLAPKPPLLDPAQLGLAMPATRRYGVGFADGEIGLAWDDSRAVVGDLMAAAGNLATNDYTLGDGSVPDNDEGLTIWVDYGGSVIRYVGARVQSMRWEFNGNAPIVLTAGFLAQTYSGQVAVAITAPAESGIVWESDMSGFTVGGTAIGGLSGFVEAQMPLVGSDRHLLGAGAIKKPVYAGDRFKVTGQLQVELTDDTGEDTEAVLNSFMAGSALGDIVLGDFLLASCYMAGDAPSLGAGVTQFPINVQAAELVVTTTT